MMTALLLLIVVLAVHSLTLSNAAEGIKFYLVPNTEAVAAVGFKKCDYSSDESVNFLR